MICMDNSCGVATYSANGKPRAATGKNVPERSGWELLAWVVLERAVDDLAIFCRAGLITPRGRCMPWPFYTSFKGGYWCRIPCFVDYMRGPKDHEKLKAWFHSDEAQEFCDLIGCRLPSAEIFSTTVNNHSK